MHATAVSPVLTQTATLTARVGKASKSMGSTVQV